MILLKEMTERMFHHSLVSFYIALQYCLSVSVPVCVLSVPTPTVGPMGAGRSPLGLLLLPFHYRFWALTLKPKRRRNTTKRRRNIFQQCNSACFVSMYAPIHSVSSFNDDDFTKTVFIIREDKEYLFTGSTVCVCSDT